MDECIVCHEPLGKFEKIYAGLGHLFCSKTCAAKHLVETVEPQTLAEYAVTGCVEEVTPDEIGIDKVVVCDWCGLDFDDGQLTKTDLGMLCDRCIAAIRSRGEEVIIIDDGGYNYGNE